MTTALSSAQNDLLERYLDLLLAANEHMNLTGITDRATAKVVHLADSLTLLEYLGPPPGKLADIGSGGGVPGIPLAIARPDMQVVLIESTRKKAAFLDSAVAQLKLPNVRVLPQRAEEVAHGPRRESFDFVVVRAVAAMIWLAEWSLPLLKIGGKLLALKGPKSAGELPLPPRVLARLGGQTPLVHPSGRSDFAGHVIIEIPKSTPSDPHLPRDPTKAKGKPLT